MPRRPRYYEPEDLGPEQDRRDAAVPNRRFYVYVLETDFGHYVGHTAHIGRRLREHQDNETPSTAGGNATLAWRSRPFRERADAARFEAAMKSLRDQRAVRYREITGLDPSPFFPARAPSRAASRRDWQRRYGHGRRERRIWAAALVGLALLALILADSLAGLF